MAEPSLGLLEGLGSDGERILESRVRELRVPEGTRIFDAGDPADALYVIRSGLVDICSPSPTGHVRISTLGPGESFGEVGVITGRARAASALAQTGVTLWRLALPDFFSLMATEPRLASNVAAIISDRLQAMTRSRVGFPHGQTVVVWCDRPPAVAAAGSALRDACTRMLGEPPVVLASGPAESWGRTRLPRTCEVVDPEHLAGVAVRAVREHPLVLILCSPEVPPALGGADRLVILSDEAELQQTDAGPARVSVLERRPGRDRFEALAREVCGRRIGLVLGSGGLRGFAHAGVLEVFHEEEIPIDVIGGASAGAIAAALVQRGWSPADLADLLRAIRETFGTGIFPGLSLSPHSLLSGRRLRTFFRKRLGADTKIEDLAIPLVVAATDLDSRNAVHLTEGPLADAIAASSAVPGVFPPVSIDGRRLVDGGVSDPVPVQAVRDRGADVIVAVNPMAIGRGPMGVYTRRIRIPMPGPVEALFIGLDTIVTQLAVHSSRQADIVIEPGTSDGRWYEVVPAATYKKAGERAARAVVADIRKLLGE